MRGGGLGILGYRGPDLQILTIYVPPINAPVIIMLVVIIYKHAIYWHGTNENSIAAISVNIALANHCDERGSKAYAAGGDYLLPA